MRLLYAPGLSDSDARIEALRACINGIRNDTNGVGAAGTARQHAVRVGNRGGMAVLICTRRPKFQRHSSRKLPGDAAFAASRQHRTASGASGAIRRSLGAGKIRQHGAKQGRAA
jgi:hypothetical protein